MARYKNYGVPKPKKGMKTGPNMTKGLTRAQMKKKDIGRTGKEY